MLIWSYLLPPEHASNNDVITFDDLLTAVPFFLNIAEVRDSSDEHKED